MPDGTPGIPAGWTMAWSRPVGWILDHLVYRTSVTGRHNVPTGGPVIFAGNHISFLDGPVMFGASPRPMHILVKQEMFTGFLGRVLTASGQLPVDRSGDRAALQRCRKVLDAGRCVGILPEGTRGSGAAEDINGGVAWLALNSGAPVVPVSILGTRKGDEHPRFRTPAGQAVPRQLRQCADPEPQGRGKRPCFNGQGGAGDPGRTVRARAGFHSADRAATAGGQQFTKTSSSSRDAGR
jgi:1-acyl-sn-glycerol-3-phosphate acyltransferase